MENMTNQELGAAMANKFDSIDAKLSEIVSVKRFGAKGDGVSDDTTAIQNAINFGETNYNASDMNVNIGYKLAFPPGHYKISSSLVFKAPVYVVGLGGTGSIIISPLGAAIDLITLADTTESIRFNITNIRFKYIPNGKVGIKAVQPTLDGIITRCWFDGWGGTTGTAISGEFSDFLIEGNVFENLKNCFVGDTHHGENRIVNNIFYKCLGSAIVLNGLDSPYDWQTKHSIIANNHFNFPYSSGVPMINLNKYHKCIIISNTLNGSAPALIDRFISASYAHDIIISTNILDGIVLHGIFLSNCYKCNINNNTITKNTTVNSVAAIYVKNGNNNIINGNIIYDFGIVAGSYGILMESEQKDIVTFNNINDVQYGIRETGASLYNKIKDNNIDTNVTTKYVLLSGDHDDRINQIEIRGTGDYGLSLTSAENQVYNANLTSFATIALPANAYKGMKFRIIRNDTGASSLQIYDAFSSTSLGSYTNKKCLECICDGTAWKIASICMIP